MSVLVSVIVPVWNDEKRIDDCILALKNQQLCDTQYEIIVVDNGSDDGTWERICKHENVIALQEPTPGSYVARNKAIQVAQGTYLAFTDSDCIVSENWLSSHLKLAQSTPGFGVIAGDVRFFSPENADVEPSAMNFESLFSMNQQHYSQQGVSITANWFSRKKTIEDFGGFDSRLKSGGDHALSKRISSQGLAVLFNAEAYVHHPARNVSELIAKRKRVIGGAWDRDTSTTKALKLVWRSTKLIIKRMFIVTRAQKITAKEKLSLFSLLSVLYITSVAEVCKLTMGGVSNRS